MKKGFIWGTQFEGTVHHGGESRQLDLRHLVTQHLQTGGGGSWMLAFILLSPFMLPP